MKFITSIPKPTKVRAGIFILLATLLTPVSLFRYALAATGQFSLSASSANVQKGSSTTVSLSVTPGTPIDGVDTTLAYDKSKLQFVSLDTSGSVFPVKLTESNGDGTTNGDGVVRIARGKLDGTVSAKGLIGTVTFKAVSDSGSDNLKLTGNATQDGAFTGPADATTTLSFGTTQSPPPPTPEPDLPKFSVEQKYVGYKRVVLHVSAERPVRAQVLFGTDKDHLNTSTKWTGYATGHDIVLGEQLITPGVTYYYKVVVEDRKGNKNESDIDSFTTKGYQIRMLLTDSKEQPLRNKKVTLHSEPITVTTDQDGYAVFESVPPGNHHVEYEQDSKTYSEPVHVIPATIYDGKNGKQSAEIRTYMTSFRNLAEVKYTPTWQRTTVMIMVIMIISLAGYFLHKRRGAGKGKGTGSSDIPSQPTSSATDQPGGMVQGPAASHVSHKKRLPRLPKQAIVGVFVLLFAGVGTSLLLLSRAAVAVSSVQNGPWSSASTWSGGHIPEAGDIVTIEANTTVTFDQATSPEIGGMQVKGTLTFDPAKSTTLVTNQNIIVTGRLVMKPTNPAAQQFLQFAHVDDTKFAGGGMDPIASDVGLWVMGAGQLDIAGGAKTSWTSLAGGVSAGATSITLKDAPTGWRVGDTIMIAPTEPPTVGNRAYDGSEEKEITAISGNTITLKTALGWAHPQVNNMWTAEVGNLTRNVRIEGTSTPVTPYEKDADDYNDRHIGNSHIFIRSSSPQAVYNAQLRYMGTTGADERLSQPHSQAKLGRYAIHFHHCGDGSRGSVVEGVVVRDANFHQFVPHASNGIIMKDNVAYNNKSGAFWWDLHDLDPNSDSNDITWDHNLVARMHTRGDLGHTMGFFLGAGLNDKTINNTVTGAVNGNEDVGAYIWNNGNVASWVFDGNIAHNNQMSGIRVWQNSQHTHPIGNFALYYNQDWGINHGAYANDYRYFNGHIYGNGKGGLLLFANSQTLMQQRYENIVFDGAGISPMDINVDHANLPGSLPIFFSRVTIKGQKQYGVYMGNTGSENPKSLDFVNSTFEGPNPIYYSPEASTGPNNLVRVQPESGQAYQIGPNNVRTDIPAFAPTYFGNGYGLLADYFSGSDFANKVFSRREPSISDHYGEDDDQPPFWIKPWPSAFTVRWTGQFEAQADADYTFVRDPYMGIRVWVNDQPVLDAWQPSEYQVVGTPINLKKGQKYSFKAEGNFTNGYRTQIFNLLMQTPAYKDRSGNPQRIVIPMSQLYCSDPICTSTTTSTPTTPPGPPTPTPEPEPTPTPTPTPTPAPTPTPPADTTAPSASITSPANNATVSGTFNVTANATDNVGVSQVEFLIDDVSRATDTTAPYSFSLNSLTLGLSNGSHTLKARARDAAGNVNTSDGVTVTVNNTVTPPPNPEPTPLPVVAEDINQDGRVDLADLDPLVAKYGQAGTNLGRADINKDGKVDLLDFSLLAKKIRTTST